MIDKIHQFQQFLKEKIRLELGIPNKPFHEIVASNLNDVYDLFLFISLFTLFVEGLATFSVNSEADAHLTLEISMFFYASLFVVSLVFSFRLAPRIASKIKESDALATYEYLMTRNTVLNSTIVWMAVTLSAYAIFSLVTGLKQNIVDSLTSTKMTGLFISAVFGIAVTFIPWIYVMLSQVDGSELNFTELNFTLIKDVETIAKHNTYWTPAMVLRSLMKPIVHETERTLNHYLEIGKEFPAKFHHCFTTLCLVSVLGNAEENQKAKKYIAELGDILKEKRQDSSEAKMILEHLERVENDESFSSYRKMQDTFGFQYSFEHFRNRLGKSGQIILTVLTAVVLIVELIKYIFF